MVNPKSNEINRRAFIKTACVLVVAVSVTKVTSCKDEAPTELPDDCRTTDDILGPYYKAGTPIKENIIPIGDETPPLVIIGKVFSHCKDVLTDATVEIWNADAEGAYDSSDQFLFRGKYKTLADGTYRFKTIIPGKYLNGSLYRPSHIHFRITAPGHQELVSQIYFKEDPFIDTDPWASASKAKERILPIGKDVDNLDTITFDIHLLKA